MRVRSNQSGFSVVELLIVLVVLGAIGFIGYTVYRHQNNKPAVNNPTASATHQTATANDVPAAPEIHSTDDLDKAAALLDQTDTSSSSDSAALDSQLQSF